MKTVKIVLAVLLTATPIANADITIRDYSDATNDRFTNDPSFVMAGFDLSGIAQNETGRWATAISRNIVLSAAHYAPGGILRFYPGNDLSISPYLRSIVSGTRVPGTDLWLGVLDRPLPNDITHYPFATEPLSGPPPSPNVELTLAAAGVYQDANAYLLGRSPKSDTAFHDQAVGRNRITGYVENVPFQTNNDADSLIFHFDSVASGVEFEAEFNVGDSGGPTFVEVDGTLVLLGSNSFVFDVNTISGLDTGSGVNYTGNQTAFINQYIADHAPATATTINVPTDQPTIQAGIDAAVNGDEVVVAPGTYFEAINFNGKAITVRSASGTPTDTIINGTGNFHVVQCVSGEGPDTVLSGFTITGGNANGGGPDNNGGGMYIVGSNPTVTHCVFNGNSAADGGGGMYNDNSNPIVTRCTFNGNAAGFAGGGMANFSGNPTVTSCTFVGNSSVDAGGMYNSGSSPEVTNCTFDGNMADNDGAGMLNDGGSVTVTNCTFVNNRARTPYDEFDSSAGGMLNYDSSPAVTNCVFWGNFSEQILNFGSAPTVTYSNVQGGYPGTGNIDSYPGFTGDYRLSPSSPCIDAGNNTAVPADVTDLDSDGDTAEAIPLDLGGHPRFVDDGCVTDTGVPGNGHPDAVVDMGAYEYQESVFTVINVPAEYATIQQAIDAAKCGDEVAVAPGTYVEAINFNGKAIRVRSASGNPADTIIDGNGVLHVVQCVSGEGSDTVLSGFTITGGNANGASFPDNAGGGMLNNNASPTVTNCIFSGNSASESSGGGGGMYNDNSPTVTGCTFTGNTARFGGGMYTEGGGAPVVTNCRFIGNSAGNGGGMEDYNASTSVTNCTFSGNTANGGGGLLSFGSNTLVRNCVFWGNALEEMFDAFSTTSVTYSNVQGGHPGVGNIDLDPLFVSPAGGDYRLSAGSPCIDAGDNTAVPADTVDLDGDGDTAESIPLDLAGIPRFVDDLGTTDTGVPGNGYPNAVVDMGAYEYAFAPVTGDLDLDGDVDLDDFGILAGCMLGPGVAYPVGCGTADLDGDGDVDIHDFARFQHAYPGK